MNRLARHEAFQRWVAKKCGAAGAIVISTSTTAPCDLVVQPKFHGPIFVEIKTKGRGQGRTGALKPLQKALRNLVRFFPEYGAWFALVTRSWGKEGPRVTIVSEPKVCNWLEEALHAP